MNRILKIIFIVFVVKPLVLIILGLNVKNRQKLPVNGPAVIAANHNSHLDTLVIFSLYPLSKVHKLRPVAAADYFLSNKLMAWFSLNVIGIIPLSRSGEIDKEQLFSGCHQALDAGDILILFPEGSRGKPEKTGKLKKGIYHLIKDRPETSLVPLVTHGLGRALPRGEALFVPFNCDVVVGDKLPVGDSSGKMLAVLDESFNQMLHQCPTFHEED